jgi:hypothetical protein
MTIWYMLQKGITYIVRKYRLDLSAFLDYRALGAKLSWQLDKISSCYNLDVTSYFASVPQNVHFLVVLLSMHCFWPLKTPDDHQAVMGPSEIKPLCNRWLRTCVWCYCYWGGEFVNPNAHPNRFQTCDIVQRCATLVVLLVQEVHQLVRVRLRNMFHQNLAANKVKWHITTLYFTNWLRLPWLMIGWSYYSIQLVGHAFPICRRKEYSLEVCLGPEKS